MSWKSLFRLLVSALFAAALLYFSIRGIDTRALVLSLQNISVFWLLISLGIQFAAIVARGLRWGVQLDCDSVHKYTLATGASVVGALMNMILPIRGGDAIRIWTIHRFLGYSLGFIGGTLVAEFATDALLAAGLGFWLYHSGVGLPQWVNTSALLIAMSLLGGISVIYIMRSISLRLANFNGLCRNVINPLVKLSNSLHTGLRSLQTGFQASAFLMATIGVWLFDVLLLWCLSNSFYLEIGLGAALQIGVALALSRVLPSTPGYIGIYQFVLVSVMMPMGATHEQAIGISVVLQLIAVGEVAVLGMGFWFLFKNLSGHQSVL